MSADLLALTPGQFEDLVADYLSAAGYQDVQRIGGAGDEGVDIRCRDDDGRLVVVQCKRYKPTSRIGSPEIQVFHGRVVRHRATDGGIFATSASFTAPAINEA